MTDNSPEALIAEARSKTQHRFPNPGVALRLADALERELARNARMVEALKPFADGCLVQTGPKWDLRTPPDPSCCRYCAARKALEENGDGTEALKCADLDRERVRNAKLVKTLECWATKSHGALARKALEENGDG